MSISVTPIYAALVALLFVVLSFYVILYRRSKLISVGDKGDKVLLTRMRAHANCAEYAPIALFLLLLLELSGTPAWALHALGVALLAGRVMHAYGFTSHPQIFLLRQAGMILTFAMIVISAVVLFIQAVF
jgi:uncharacterized membrane protein YecN with MAPEG domain